MYPRGCCKYANWVKIQCSEEENTVIKYSQDKPKSEIHYLWNMPSVNTNAAKSEKTKARRETLATKQQAEAEMI